MNLNVNNIKKLIYVIYPSGLGGEFLSYIISNSIVDCNRNSANLNPELNGAWQGNCLFQFFADVSTNEDRVNQEYIEKHNPDFSKWFVCKDHPRDDLYKFLLKKYPYAKIILLMPDGPDKYFANLCISKTSKLIEATEENLNKFLSHNYKELFAIKPVPPNWDHYTTEKLVNYQPYYKKLKEVYFSSKYWRWSELWFLVSSILNNGTYLKHNPNIEDLINDRANEYNQDIKNLQGYINNFDTLIIPGNCYKKSPDKFFTFLSSKFKINYSNNIKDEFQDWINNNNKIVYG